MGCPNYGALYMVGSRSSGWVQRIADSANVETPLSGNTYGLIAVPIRQDFGAGCEPLQEQIPAKLSGHFRGIPPT